MGFLDLLGRRERPFPEKGIYKGVKYRIDGDAIMLEASNGREIQLAPGTPAPIYDDSKRDAISGARSLLLKEQRPTMRYYDGTAGESGLGTIHEFWGISNKEFDNLYNLGQEIMTRYHKSPKPKDH